MRSLIPPVETPAVNQPAAAVAEAGAEENLFLKMISNHERPLVPNAERSKAKKRKTKKQEAPRLISTEEQLRGMGVSEEAIAAALNVCERPPVQIAPRITDAQLISRLSSSDSIHLVAREEEARVLKRLLDGVILDISRSGNWSPNRFAAVSTVSIWTNDNPIDRAYAYGVAQEIFRCDDRRAKIRIYVTDFDGEDPIESERLIWSSIWETEIDRQEKSQGYTFKLDPFKNKKALRPVSWVWEGILPRGGIAILGGAPGAGKSVTSLGLASCIVRGRPFAGRDTAKGSAVYIAFEGMENAIQSQLEGMGGRNVTLIHCAGPQTVEQGISEIFKLAVTISPSLIIVDTLQKLLNGINLSSGLEYERTSDAMGRLSSIGKRTGTSFLFNHHSGNSGDLLGNKALSGAADAVLLISNRHVLSAVKQRFGESLAAVKLNYDQRSFQFIDAVTDHADRKSEQFLTALGCCKLTKAELRKKLPTWSGKTFNDVASRLIVEGRVIATTGKTKTETVYAPLDLGEMELLDTGLDTESLDISLDTRIPICPDLIQV